MLFLNSKTIHHQCIVIISQHKNVLYAYENFSNIGQDSGQEISFFYVIGFAKENIEYPINP